MNGTYDPVWWLAVALAFGSALIHVPIREEPVRRAEVTAAEPTNGRREAPQNV